MPDLWIVKGTSLFWYIWEIPRLPIGCISWSNYLIYTVIAKEKRATEEQYDRIHLCPLCIFSAPFFFLLIIITSLLYVVPIIVSFRYTSLLSSPLGINALLACLTGKYSRSQLARCPQIERLPSVLTPPPQIPGQFSRPASQVNLGCSLHPRTPSPEPMPNPPPVAQTLLPFPCQLFTQTREDTMHCFC